MLTLASTGATRSRTISASNSNDMRSCPSRSDFWFVFIVLQQPEKSVLPIDVSPSPLIGLGVGRKGQLLRCTSQIGPACAFLTYTSLKPLILILSVYAMHFLDKLIQARCFKWIRWRNHDGIVCVINITGNGGQSLQTVSPHCCARKVHPMAGLISNFAPKNSALNEKTHVGTTVDAIVHVDIVIASIACF